MSFPKYPAYKDSGVDWLGEVPAHWVDRKIARDIPFVVGWTPPSGKDEFYDGDLPWVTIADMTQSTVEDTQSKITPLAVREKGAKIVPAGSMLFSFKLSVGKVAFLKIDSYTNEAIAGFLPSENLELGYWKYAAPEFIPRYGRENIYGATLLNQELISSVRFFAPEGTEQTQIARFLDHETARIDALIEEQQRLIELLKEKRQAVISHAVTKGLDPSVPMKDSGVEWLGEVPAHWEVTRIGWQCLVGNGCTPSRDNQNYWDDGHFPWLNSSKVNLSRVVDSDQFVTNTALRECALPIVKPGSVLMAITGEGRTRGMVTITEIEATISQHIAFMEPRGSALTSSYLHDWLRANYEKIRHESADWGSTKAAITCADIRAYPLPLPPIDEQKRISQFIEEKSSLFDELTLAADENVNLLQERRSALISAAVTGKIDLRGWQPPAGKPAPLREQETA